jgi:filamentous hemagglutinin family protein
MATTKRAKLLDKASRSRAPAAREAQGARTSRNTHPRSIALAVAAAFVPWFVPAAHAQIAADTLPTGGQVSAGAANISTNGSKMQIDQSTNRAILNWQSFSIGSAAWVNFTQPGASSVALNRVVGNDPSHIFGRFTANGQVFLVNNAGVFFAPGASVDVSALFASTLSITDQDFLAGRYKFFNPGNAGSVVNQGNIVTANGYTALVGPQVRNDGVIVARMGSVVLAAADRVTLDMVGDGLISLSVDQATLNASVINTGRIEADGGTVLLAARSANALLDTVINNSGIIRANSLIERNGEIVLDGGSAGVVAVSGTLKAAGVDAGTTGGTVKVLGHKVGLYDGTRIEASGDAGGGTALIGGNFQGKGPEQNAFRTFVGEHVSINADAHTNGDGGKVIVWANDSTRFHGTISARGGAQRGDGGFVEVSGKEYLIFRGSVDARAPRGATGTLLLDPKNITIDDSGAATALADVDEFADGGGANDVTIDRDTINAAGANVVLQANNDITLAASSDISIAGAGISLTMQSGRSILLNSDITTNGAAITLTANETVANGVQDANRDAGAAVIVQAAGTTLTSGGSNITLTMSTGPTTNNTSGDITLAGIDAGTGHVLVVNNGPTAGSGIVRADGTQLITAASAALDVNGAGGGGEIGSGGAPIRITVTNLEARSPAGAFFTSPTQGANVGGATLGGLTGITTTGDLSLTTNGAITDSEALSITGTTTLTAGATTSRWMRRTTSRPFRWSRATTCCSTMRTRSTSGPRPSAAR